MGIGEDGIYVDHGLAGRNRNRPGLGEALAACRAGDTFVVTKLDRLARSVCDAHEIADESARRDIKLNIGGSVHNPLDPIGKLIFNVLAMVAEFEGDLIRARTREGMKVAKAKGHLRGKPPKLSPAQERHLVMLHAAGEHSMYELSELYSVARSTVYRALDRAKMKQGGDLALLPATGLHDLAIFATAAGPRVELRRAPVPVL